MAAKKSSRRQSRRARRQRGRGALDRELKQLAKRIESGVRGLGRELDAAQAKAGREAARLLHQARGLLAKAEIRGSSRWRELLRSSRADLVAVLARLEKSVRSTARRGKAARRKRAAGGNKTAPRKRSAGRGKARRRTQA